MDYHTQPGSTNQQQERLKLLSMTEPLIDTGYVLPRQHQAQSMSLHQHT